MLGLVVVPTGGALTFIGGCRGAAVVAHKATCGRGRWINAAIATRGVVVADIGCPCDMTVMIVVCA